MASETVLLVEGKDDQDVVWNLLRHHGLEQELEFKGKTGIDNLLRAFPQELRASDLKRLGLMIDADTRAAGRWERISQVLKDRGYALPDVPDPTGTIVTRDGQPSVGVWFMPDNTADGMIEDFVRLLVPVDDQLLDRARGCVDSIPAEQRRFPAQQRSKALIHTWLAWQEEPGQPMGLAITKKFLRADSDVGHGFVAWIRRLLAA